MDRLLIQLVFQFGELFYIWPVLLLFFPALFLFLSYRLRPASKVRLVLGCIAGLSIVHSLYETFFVFGFVPGEPIRVDLLLIVPTMFCLWLIGLILFASVKLSAKK